MKYQPPKEAGMVLSNYMPLYLQLHNWSLSWETGFLHMRKRRRRSRSAPSIFAKQRKPSTTYIRNFKPLDIFCGCTVRFVSDLVETPKTGFLASQLNSIMGDNSDKNVCQYLMRNSYDVFSDSYRMDKQTDGQPETSMPPLHTIRRIVIAIKLLKCP